MELTARDKKLVTDVALHHVITRDQMIALGYFPCVKRANRRLLTLVKAGLLERVRMNHCLAPKQSVYRAPQKAAEILDPRVAAVLRERCISTLQFDHAIAVIDARIKLVELGATRWLAEPQCRHRFEGANGAVEVRPDGVAFFDGRILFVEVDRGHVSLPRIKAKLKGLGIYKRSGALERAYRELKPALLIVTTGELRVQHIKSILPKDLPIHCFVITSEAFHGASTLSEVAR